jgi:hypothetical protein
LLPDAPLTFVAGRMPGGWSRVVASDDGGGSHAGFDACEAASPFSV